MDNYMGKTYNLFVYWVALPTTPFYKFRDRRTSFDLLTNELPEPSTVPAT